MNGNWKEGLRRGMSGFLAFTMAGLLVLGDAGTALAGLSADRLFQDETSLWNDDDISGSVVDEVSFENQELDGVLISVSSENSDFRPGEDVTLNIYVKNETDQTITGGTLSYEGNGIQKSTGDLTLLGKVDVRDLFALADEDDSETESTDLIWDLDENDDVEDLASESDWEWEEDIEAERDGITLEPGEIYAAQFEYVVDKSVDERTTEGFQIDFRFEGTGEEDDTIEAEETFSFTANYLNVETPVFEDGNLVKTGETVTMGIHANLHQVDSVLTDSWEDASPSDAEEAEENVTVATPSQASAATSSATTIATSSNATAATNTTSKVATASNALATASDAEEEDPSAEEELIDDRETTLTEVDLNEVRYEIEMYNAKLNGFKVKKAMVDDAEDNMLICTYRVSNEVEPGVYFGKITQISEANGSTYESTQGFALIVEGEGEITLEGSLGDTLVTVTGPVNAFPEADELEITVSEVSAEMEEIVDTAIQRRAEEDGFSVNAYRALDIKLYADGEEIEPSGSLQVTFKNVEMEEKSFIEKAVETVTEIVSNVIDFVKGLFSAADDREEDTTDVIEGVRITELRRVYHYEEQAAIVEKVPAIETEEGDILIETDELSVYVVADIAPNGVILTATDEQNVKVTVQGELPKEAGLTLTKLEKQKLDELTNELNANGINSEGIWQFGYDINVGKQDSFEEPVTVTISDFSLGYYNYDNLYVKVYHIHDGKIEVIDSATITKEGITFQTNSFSAYYFDVGAVEDQEEVANSIAEPGDEILKYLYPEQYRELETFDWESWLNEFATDEETSATVEASDEKKDADYLEEEVNATASAYSSSGLVRATRAAGSGELSDSQIVNSGGTSSTSDGVMVSKTIDGTDDENVFDITLKVTTETDISEVIKDPDMAVVMVMDVSNTMKQAIGTKTTTSDYNKTRYKAVIDAAENFLDTFADNTSGVSKVGFVAFNTSSTQIFPLSSCSSTNEADSLKTTMRNGTYNIIYADGYASSWSRFTNIESGLKRARDMLSNASNENKYIIFLSDGMPTTYINGDGYTGYEPHSSSGKTTRYATDYGVFYDSAKGVYCSGTNYSDNAAIRARQMATTIKQQEITIFSVGVDVGLNTIEGYDNASNVSDTVSYIDRRCTKANMTKDSSYEIGSYSSSDGYKNWLKGTADGSNSTGIGSGYYYDSSDAAGLNAAYEDIFEKIREMNAASTAAKWVATDPMPTITSGSTVATTMDFLGFYDKNGDYLACPDTYTLTGSDGSGNENTASYSDSTASISWDLKNSGWTSSKSGNTTTYTYTLTYRVRLKNEITGFVEGQTYVTNGTTPLVYEVETTDGGSTSYEEKTVYFQYPSVQGYLGEFAFKKVDDGGEPVSGVTFTLTHDTSSCGTCRGDGASSVSIDPFTATSDANGDVTFNNIPSGHTYTLQETSAPSGYTKDSTVYTVTVAMGETTVNLISNQVVNTKTTAVTVTKVWEDGNNSDNTRPSSVEVTLYDSDDNKVTEDASNTSINNPVTLSSANSWTNTWTNLNVYDDNGKGIEYKVKESAASWLSDTSNEDGWYTGEVTGNASSGFTITNTYTPVYTNITVQKDWDDEDNQFSLRPASITVYLYQKQGDSTVDTKTVDLSESNVDQNGYWSYTWSDLPKFYFKDTDSDGIPEKYEYIYSADEDTTFATKDHYYDPVITGADGDGIITITNTLMTAELQLKKIVKIGANDEGIDESPYKFQIRLLGSDGEIYTAVALANGDESGIIWLTPTEAGLTYTIIEVVPMEYELIGMEGEEKANSGDYTSASVFNKVEGYNGSTITVYPGDYAYVTLTNQPSHDTYFHRTASVTNHWTLDDGFDTYEEGVDDKSENEDLYVEEPERDKKSDDIDFACFTRDVMIAATFEIQGDKKSQKGLKEGDELRG